MITEREKRALQLAKKVFEHFTHDALPFARDIIAMELELGAEPAVNSEPENGLLKPILEAEKKDGQPINELLNDFPVSDISAIGLDDPVQPVKQMNDELVCQQQDDFPF